MKKQVLGLLLLFAASTFTYAQSGADNLKNASKLMAKFNKDPFNSADLLTEATGLLESAFSDESVNSSAQSWITRGDIYKTVAEAQSNNKLLNPDYAVAEPMAAVISSEAFMKAFELAKASGDSKLLKKVTKSALSGLSDVEGQLNNYGVGQYQLNDFDGALRNFQMELDLAAFLKTNGEKTRLEDQALMDEKIYFTAVTASQAENHEVAIPLLEKLVSGEQSEAVLYTFLYTSLEATGMNDKAAAVLTEGRAKYPEDSNLLFSEINYYLKKGELTKMIGNLESALVKEPDNVSIITTLGQVYDQLSVKSDEGGDDAKSIEYYEKAGKFYADALSQNPDNFDLNYSMGALHYNRAATLTDDLNKLSDDFSSAGQRKYDEMKATMAGFFDKALPYFLKADGINGEDRNTLIALKEISARKDDFAGSNAYKERLEALGN